MAALTKIRSCRSQAEYLQQNAGLSVGGAHVLNPGQPEPSIKPIRIQDLGPGLDVGCRKAEDQVSMIQGSNPDRSALHCSTPGAVVL